MANKTLEKTSGSIFDAPAFQTTQSNDVIESKGITVWAVAALVVAALSLLAFVHLAFLALSVIAILFSLVAFLTIWKGGGEVAGKRLAIVALALATLTAIGGPVRRVVYRIAFERQAAEFCEVWFDAAKRGRLPNTSNDATPLASRHDRDAQRRGRLLRSRQNGGRRAPL